MEIIVNYHPDYADVITQQDFSKIASRYDVICIGHDKDRTYSLFLPNDIDISPLEQDLNKIGIEIIET